MVLRKSLRFRLLIAILAATMMVVALACAGKDATPTSPPTATSPAPTATSPAGAGATATAVAEATATAVPEVDLESLPWIERLVHLPGYKPEWGTPKKTGGILKAGLAASWLQGTPSGGGTFDGPMNLAYNNLVRFDPWAGTNSIIPDLAKSWEVSGDGLQITFRLEEGVKFQDNPNIPERLRNADFTCEDVQASMERYLFPETWDTQGGQRPLGHVNSISCPDGPLGYTAVFKLDLPKAKTLGALAGNNPVMLDKGWREWVNTEVGTKQKALNDESFKRLTGTGPFGTVEYQPDVIGKVRRNPTYFREGLPLLDGVDSYILKDYTTRFTALATGQINLMGHGSIAMLSGQVAQAQRDFPDRIVIHHASYTLGYGVLFVTNRPPFDDVRVRRAIHLAIDRDAWLEFKRSGTYEGATLATPSVAPGTYWTATEEELRTWPGYRQPKDQDIAEANRLLDEVFGKGNRIKTSCTSGNQQQRIDICLFFKDQMKKHLNIDMTIESLEQAVIQGDIGQRCLFQIGAGSVGSTSSGDPDDSLFSFHREYVGAGYTGCGVRFVTPSEFQAEIEALIGAQSIELDPVKRRVLVRALDWKITQEAIYSSEIGWVVTFYGTTPSVKGYALTDTPSTTRPAIYDRVWLVK